MSDYDIYGVCPCGWYEKAPFGMLFHIHREVCPECGTDKSEWETITGKRVNKGSWWNPKWHIEKKTS